MSLKFSIWRNLLLALAFCGLVTLAARTWTKADGGTFDAEIAGVLQVDGGILVEFRNQAGSFRYSLDRLAPADAERIRSRLQMRADGTGGVLLGPPPLEEDAAPVMKNLYGTLYTPTADRWTRSYLETTPQLFAFVFGNARDSATAVLIESITQLMRAYPAAHSDVVFIYVPSEANFEETRQLLHASGSPLVAVHPRVLRTPQGRPILNLMSSSIPALTVTDPQGRVLAHSMTREEGYIGPGLAMTRLEELLKQILQRR